MGLELKKSNVLRKRFIKTLPFINFDNYLSELQKLKEFIAQHSLLQIVGNKVYVKFDEDQSISLMLEVIGVPYNRSATAPVLFDLNPIEVLIHKIQDMDLFTIDLQTLLAKKDSIVWALKKNDRLKSPIYHIVVENEKIELHFFGQKDYIQRLL